MNGYNYRRLPSNTYLAVDDLTALKRRLKPGQRVTGRVLDVLNEHQIMLRIWNYNILTHVSEPLRSGSEVVLAVEAVEPRFQFRLLPSRKKSPAGINVEVK